MPSCTACASHLKALHRAAVHLLLRASMEALGRWLVTNAWPTRQEAAPLRLTGITAAALKDFVRDRFGGECVQRIVAQQLEPALQAAWAAPLAPSAMVDEEAYLR